MRYSIDARPIIYDLMQVERLAEVIREKLEKSDNIEAQAVAEIHKAKSALLIAHKMVIE